jgi:hypothetical protein
VNFDVFAPKFAMRGSPRGCANNTDTRTGTQCSTHLDGRFGMVRTEYRYGPRLHAELHRNPLPAGHLHAIDNSCTDAG